MAWNTVLSGHPNPDPEQELARGRTAQPQPAADLLPGDTKPVPLTKPVILFAVIRAIAVSIAVAIAFGCTCPMPTGCRSPRRSPRGPAWSNPRSSPWGAWPG
jgi:hypothetical protein